MVDPVKSAGEQAANTVAKGAVAEVEAHPKTFLYIALAAAAVVVGFAVYFLT